MTLFANFSIQQLLANINVNVLDINWSQDVKHTGCNQTVM